MSTQIQRHEIKTQYGLPLDIVMGAGDSRRHCSQRRLRLLQSLVEYSCSLYCGCTEKKRTWRISPPLGDSFPQWMRVFNAAMPSPAFVALPRGLPSCSSLSMSRSSENALPTLRSKSLGVGLFLKPFLPPKQEVRGCELTGPVSPSRLARCLTQPLPARRACPPSGPFSSSRHRCS